MSLFGTSTTTNPTGGLFGASQPQQQQQSGGLFGQNKPAGLFGQPATNTPQQPGGLFGQSSTQPSTGGGLFGSTQQQPQQQQQSGGLFGQSQQQTGGGLFGAQQQQQPQQGGGLFGGSLQQPQQQSGGGLFSSTQQPQQQQQQGGFFAQPATASQYGMNQSVQFQQQQAQNPICEKIERIHFSWDPEHPDYAFRYYFYNHYGEAIASQYQKPPNEDLSEWDKAWAERPNKGCIPVLAKGFSDLNERVKLQEQLVASYRASMHQLLNRLDSIQNHHDLQTSLKIEDCRRRHNILARRALSLAAKVQVLKNQGYALQPEEEMLKKRLEGLAKVVQDPATSGRMNEIWARMTIVAEKAKTMQESLGKVEIVWDEKQLQIAGKLLQSNAAGLEHLHKEVKDIEAAFARWDEQHKDRTRGL